MAPFQVLAGQTNVVEEIVAPAKALSLVAEKTVRLQVIDLFVMSGAPGKILVRMQLRKEKSTGAWCGARGGGGGGGGSSV